MNFKNKFNKLNNSTLKYYIIARSQISTTVQQQQERNLN